MRTPAERVSSANQTRTDQRNDHWWPGREQVSGEVRAKACLNRVLARKQGVVTINDPGKELSVRMNGEMEWELKTWGEFSRKH